MSNESSWRDWLTEWTSEISPGDEALLRSIEDGTSILDGVMSPQTKALVAAFDCKGVDMDMLWAYTPMAWKCPACQRSKIEIARRNKNGDLMCRLVEHHDHMKDLLLKKFESISAGLERVLANEAAEQFAKRSAPMVSAYDNTVICNDCNNADAIAKRLAKTHPSFSYSPNEILNFVIATPNAEHHIDSEAAARIWEENRATFELRMKIVARIAEIAAKDEHWYQSTPFQHHPNHVKRTAENIAYNKRAWFALRVLCGPTRQQPQKEPSSWRTKVSNERVKIPTPGQIEHVAKVTSHKRWNSVADDWRCPGCGRSKSQIVRPTKQSTWALPIASKYYRDTSDKQGYSTQAACDDCGNAAINIVKEAVVVAKVVVETYSRLVGLDEIAEFVIPKPHSGHRFDNDQASEVVQRIAVRLNSREADQLGLL
ncbi:hypothetical protein ACN9MY_06180 [Pseudoduganella sp. R-31]|uniref:hypothetical protein n=1 Tax=Pseudoduganella sp. R-31 TaxID=3404060 RepID=UPI003CF4BB59